MKKKIRVLIVDDEPDNVEIMLEILSFYPHYECQWATSGEQALTVLKVYHPEIILLDVRMPGIDGYEVCRRVRAQSEHRFSKILMISGLSHIDDRLRGYEAGADDYLAKPYQEAEFIAKLEVYSKLNRIEEVDTLKTTAMNILRHEIRTPLNGIIMGSDLLEDMDDLSPKARTYVQLVGQSGLKIQELVKKICRYYVLKDGIVLQPSSPPLNTAICSIINKLKGDYPASTLLVQCTGTGQFGADWELLAEAINHLVDDVLKTSSDQRVGIYCRQQETQLVIEIGDQTLGQDSIESQDVFAGLFSADLLHHHQGSGLGLAIANEIIEEHGGQIHCRKRASGEKLFDVVLRAQTTG